MVRIKTRLLKERVERIDARPLANIAPKPSTWHRTGAASHDEEDVRCVRGYKYAYTVQPGLFGTQTGHIFSESECQLVCALYTFIRSEQAEYITFATLPAEDILFEIILSLRARSGWPRMINTLSVSEPLCCSGLYFDILDNPNPRYSQMGNSVMSDTRWNRIAAKIFARWVAEGSRLAQEYVLHLLTNIDQLTLAPQLEWSWSVGSLYAEGVE